MQCSVCLQDGRTALIYAAVSGQEEVVAFLLEHKADVNQQTRRGWDALLYSAVDGHAGVAEALLQAKADVEHTAPDGWSALTAAVKQGHMQLATILSSAEATLTARRKRGRRKLQLSMRGTMLSESRKRLSNGRQQQR